MIRKIKHPSSFRVPNFDYQGAMAGFNNQNRFNGFPAKRT